MPGLDWVVGLVSPMFGSALVDEDGAVDDVEGGVELAGVVEGTVVLTLAGVLGVEVGMTGTATGASGVGVFSNCFFLSSSLLRRRSRLRSKDEVVLEYCRLTFLCMNLGFSTSCCALSAPPYP